MGTVVPFKPRSIIRCRYCNAIKPGDQDTLFHRGVDYLDNSRAHFWSVFSSGWKKIEVVPVQAGKADRTRRKLYYQCARCSALHG